MQYQEYAEFTRFKWVEDFGKTPSFWNVPEDNEVGYLLEVDLGYLKELHDDYKSKNNNRTVLLYRIAGFIYNLGRSL